MSKVRYYVDTTIFLNLYYALIYSFLINGIIVWGNTYPSTIEFLYVLQKKAVRIITFSRFDEHSNPLFKTLNIIKLFDLVSNNIAFYYV